MSKTNNKEPNNEIIPFYSENDIKKFKDYLPELDKKQNENKMKLLEPKIEERNEVLKTILKYIKTAKRKIYGGFAQNMYVKLKNKDDAIYGPYSELDIEFYSNEPLKDVKNLCDKLLDSGFKDIQGYEATHDETYTITVNYVKYCDVSYVPTNIYNKIPTRVVDGLELVDPSFMFIDFYRLINDPLTSYWRVEKTFKRLCLLQKYYPLKNISKPANFPNFEMRNHPEELDKYYNSIFDFSKNKESILLFGYFAYYYLKNNKLPKTDSIKSFEIISVDYVNDCTKILESLKEANTKEKDLIKIEEYYPFFQFTGRKLSIYVNSVKIADIYNNSKMCIPFMDVKLDNTSKIRLVTFSYVIRMALILGQKNRVDKNQDESKNQQFIVTDLFNTKNKFMEKNNKTLLDDTRFKELQLECVGETEEQPRLYRKRLKTRKLKGLPLVRRYNPETDRDKTFTFNFKNTSGNIINNDKNKKIFVKGL